MKKLINVLLVMMVMAVAVPASAQIKFGVKGGIDFVSSLSGSTWKHQNMKKPGGKTGYYIGPMVEVGLPFVSTWDVDAALLFSTRGHKFDNHTARQIGVEIPINLKKTFEVGDMLGVFVAAGPSLYYNVKSEKRMKMINSGTLDYEALQVAINVGVGVKLMKHFQVSVNYSIPLNDTATFHQDASSTVPDPYDGKSYKTQGFHAAVAYLF